MSKNPLLAIYEPYFEDLNKIFGNLVKEARKHKTSATDIAHDYLSNDTRRQHFIDELPNLSRSVIRFWKINRNEVREEINKIPGSLARFGGDIGPHFDEHIFQKAGVYFDSIIVADPLLKISEMHLNSLLTKRQEYYFLKYAIELLLEKEFYLLDIYPPIAVLAPDTEFSNVNNVKLIDDLSRLDITLLLNDLYGKSFDSYEEACVFLKKFNCIENAVKNIINPNLYYFDEYRDRNPLDQLDSQIEHLNKNLDYEYYGLKSNDPMFMIFYLSGRMMQINDILLTSLNEKSNPLVTADVTYHWLEWKIKSDQDLIQKESDHQFNLDLTISNSLLSSKLAWLSNLDKDSLVKIRTHNYLSDLRSTISKQFHQINNPVLSNIDKAINLADKNLSAAFTNHQKEIDRINLKLKTDLLISIPTLLASLVISLKPSVLSISPNSLGALLPIVGTASLSSVMKQVRDYYLSKQKIDHSPIGILWKAHEKK